MSKPSEGRPQQVGGLDLEEAYRFLDELRASGVTNMFGAGSYLREVFDITKKDAKAILMAWMADFSK